MRLLTLLLLALLMAGCSQVAETPAAQTVQVGDRYVSYIPPQGWRQEGRQWFKTGQGRLTVEVFRTDAADPVAGARAWYERRGRSLRVESLEPETVAGRPGALGWGRTPTATSTPPSSCPARGTSWCSG